VAEAAGRADDARQALQEHLGAWPELAHLVAWARGVVALDRVLDLVCGLAERPEPWEDPAAVLKRLGALPAPSRAKVPLPDEVLSELAGELSRVDRVRAARYRDNLAAWKEFWDELERERAERERVLAAAEEELARLESDVQLAQAGEALARLEGVTEVLRRAERRREEAPPAGAVGSPPALAGGGATTAEPPHTPPGTAARRGCGSRRAGLDGGRDAPLRGGRRRARAAHRGGGGLSPPALFRRSFSG
jgi:hypothetical protein